MSGSGSEQTFVPRTDQTFVPKSDQTSRDGRSAPAPHPVPPPIGPSATTDDLGHLGVYKLLKVLGQGGMGKVYQAQHTRLEKLVALKVLAAGKLEDRGAVLRFEREMKAVGRLDHPHIVRALDAGNVDGTYFLVMEYVEGCDLSDVVKKLGPLPVADACELVRQAAIGLQEAHEHGMVHRDIKPSNLMLTRSPRKRTPPVLKVLDLGLALLTEAHSPDGHGLTSTGQVMGTIDYMAPEQGGDSHQVSIRADIYSLGATLFKLLAGKAPYEGGTFDTPVKKLMALATSPTPDIRTLRPDLPPGLVQVLFAMLAKNPDERFAIPEEVAEALQPFCDGCNLQVLLKKTLDEPVTADDLSQPGSTVSAGVEPVNRDSVTNQGSSVPASSRQNVTVAMTVAGNLMADAQPAGGNSQGDLALAVTASPSSLVGSTPTLPGGASGKGTRPTATSRSSAQNRPGFWHALSPSARLAWLGSFVVVTLLLGMGFLIPRIREPRSFGTQEVAPNVTLMTESESKEVPAGNSHVAVPPLAIAPFDATQAKAHQIAWAKHLGVPVEFTNSIGMKFMLIPPGEFAMGTSAADAEKVIEAVPEWAKVWVLSETPARKVQILKPFYMGTTEVTVGQFKQFVAATEYKTRAETNGRGGDSFVESLGITTRPEFTWRHPDLTRSDSHPVGQLCCEDANAFCSWLQKLDGRTYQLPDEEQWEYACRAGTVTPWSFGTSDELAQLHGITEWNQSFTGRAVAQRPANPFGMFDVHGNFDEMCRSQDGTYFNRGGSSACGSLLTRSASRGSPIDPLRSYFQQSFRVAIVGNLKP